MQRICVALLVVTSFLAVAVKGHGYMLDPPARGTAWRQGFKTPTDHNDMANYCGGRGVQHSDKNGGKCGVCGEEYSKPNKMLEPGPANKFATGTIVGRYTQGDIIEITVMTTAFHQGYYEFRLCENDVSQKGKDASIAVDYDCLNKNLLQSPQGSTQFKAIQGKSFHKVQLPVHITCQACVLQWRYKAGNNWGCENQNCALGLGPQEEFVGCSDIAILPSDGDDLSVTTTAAPKPTKPTPPATTPAVTTPAVTTPAVTTPAVTTPDVTTPDVTTPDATTPVATIPDATTADVTTADVTTPTVTTADVTTSTKTTTPAPSTSTTVKTTTTTTTPVPTTTQPVRPIPTAAKAVVQKPSGRRTCIGVSPYGAAFNWWCDANCNHNPPYCPRSHCRC